MASMQYIIFLVVIICARSRMRKTFSEYCATKSSANLYTTNFIKVAVTTFYGRGGTGNILLIFVV